MLIPSGGPKYNRLIHEQSPYLLQHARNPVDWHPWGAEAFARAKDEDKPVFLSVGYSTCHWCHVMERESFEDQEVAGILNRYFVCIKVDREERPDLDEIYMNATQILSGSGGWPNSVWLMPDGRPWYAGTYFPPEDRYGRPGFKTILLRLAELWRTRRDDVEQQAGRLAEAIRRLGSAGGVEEGPRELSRDLMDRALANRRDSFDDRHGGFGGAPKFPPHGSLRLILYEYERTKDESLLTIATRTLDAMALGGIRDHVGGGFHRYSTDARWFLPHFEKMLYDNAQMLHAYVDAYRLTRNDYYHRVAEELAAWVLREMTGPEGGFYSALDADSQGEEGKYYLWTRDELLEALGEVDGELFCRSYGAEPEGNFRDEATATRSGANVIHLQRPLAVSARVERISEHELRSRLDRCRGVLLERRDARVRPHLDDKVLAGWNGLMIGGLAFAGRELERPPYTRAAEQAARFLLTAMRKDGRLLHTFRAGSARLNAYLDDYAFLADGLLELYETTRDARWLEAAKELVVAVEEYYRDSEGGGFFFTPRDHEDLLLRSKDPFDRAIPSGNGSAARVLIRLANFTGVSRYRASAKEVLETFAPVMGALPQATESLILAAAMYLDTEPTGSLSPRGEGRSEGADARARKEPVTIEAFASRLEITPGDTVRVALKLAIDPGWHLNSNRPLEEYLIPTLVNPGLGVPATLGEVAYPSGRTVNLGFSSQPLSVYEGTTWIEAPVTVNQDVPEGPFSLTLAVRFQACNDRLCLAPETVTLEIPLRIGSDATPGDLRHPEVFASGSTDGNRIGAE